MTESEQLIADNPVFLDSCSIIAKGNIFDCCHDKIIKIFNKKRSNELNLITSLTVFIEIADLIDRRDRYIRYFEQHILKGGSINNFQIPKDSTTADQQFITKMKNYLVARSSTIEDTIRYTKELWRKFRIEIAESE